MDLMWHIFAVAKGETVPSAAAATQEGTYGKSSGKTPFLSRIKSQVHRDLSGTFFFVFLVESGDNRIPRFVPRFDGFFLSMFSFYCGPAKRKKNNDFVTDKFNQRANSTRHFFFLSLVSFYFFLVFPLPLFSFLFWLLLCFLFLFPVFYFPLFYLLRFFLLSFCIFSRLNALRKLA